MRPGQSSKEIIHSETLSAAILITSLKIRSRLTCFGMDTEGALQQMVHPFTDIHIKTWVTVLQHDFFLKILAFLGSGLEERKIISLCLCLP